MILKISINNNNIQKINYSNTNAEHINGIVAEMHKRKKGLKPFRGKPFYISLAFAFGFQSIYIRQVPEGNLGIYLLFFIIFLRITSAIFFMKSKIELIYTLDENISSSYEKVISNFKSLNNSKYLWQKIDSEAIKNSKYSAGATNSVTRESITSTINIPEFFNKLNIKIPILKLHNANIYFMPDCIILEQGNLTEYSYVDLNVLFMYTKFNEPNPPKDANIIEYSYQVVNKQGVADKRIKNNKKIPVCVYDNVVLKLGENSFHIMTSKPDAGKELATVLLEYKSCLSSYIFGK